MAVNSLQSDNAFWRFSVAVYGAPGVAAECLALQDGLAIDVNLLLFCAWLGSRNIAVTPSDIERAAVIVAPWHQQAVRPLRHTRQQLKGFPGAGQQAFRERVKALELEAEQIEQAMLFAHAQEVWPGGRDDDPAKAVAANIEAFLQSHRSGKASSTPHLIEAAARGTTIAT